MGRTNQGVFGVNIPITINYDEVQHIVLLNCLNCECRHNIECNCNLKNVMVDKNCKCMCFQERIKNEE